MDEVRISKVALLPHLFGVVVPPAHLSATIVPEGVAVSIVPRLHYPRPYRYRIMRQVAGQPDVEVAVTDTTHVIDASAPEGRVTYIATAFDLLGFESFRSDGVHVDVPSPVVPSWLGPALIAGVMLAGSLVFYWRRRAGRKTADGGRVAEGLQPVPLPDSGGAGRPGIYLFGPMLVVNAAGEDITHQFSGKVRQLLQLLILWGNGNHGGVGSEELSVLIWPEEDLRSAKNSRNVLISRLRSALKPVRGVDVAYRHGKWSVRFFGDTRCDFVQIRPHLEKSSPQSLGDTSNFLVALERGPLLKDESYPWLDSIRAEVHDQVVKLLLRLSDSAEGATPDEVRLRIADTVLLFEPLSEDALRLKVRLLIAGGRLAAARAAYDAFVREHREIVGKPYPVPFPELDSSG